MRLFLTPHSVEGSQLYQKFCYSSVLGIEDSPDFHIRPRVADDHILIYVTSGVMFCRQKGALYEVGAGDYILIDLHMRHEYWFDPSIPSEIYWMHMNGDLVKCLVDCIAHVTPLPVVDRDPAILDAIKLSHRLNSPEQSDPFSHSRNIANTLLRILDALYHRENAADAPSDDARFREEVEAVMLRSDGNIPNLDRLCSELHLTKYYFSHRFRKVFGTSPMKYVLSRRIEKAKKLLKFTNIKIRQIALEAGFQSPSNFSTVFRREVGLSPAEYRLQESRVPSDTH